MAPQRRRSSRLRGGTPAKSHTPSRLESLTERDETNSGPQSNLDTLVTSPFAPQTPATAGKIIPARSEMHPTLAHQSTANAPDDGLPLGFSDIKPQGPSQSQTPSKIGIAPDSSFDFRFARPGPQLGPEAQRMMDELREEALRIKAKLVAEREEDKRKDEESGGIAGRKFAQPKGKVGRFSDVHMAEFRKMDSIAGHPSSFRAQPGRFTPTTGGLKRSPSKAQLDDAEDTFTYKKMTQVAEMSDRLENDAPAKRARRSVKDDISSARPNSRSGITAPSTPRSQANLAHITTPTQASLARAASSKNVTQILTLSRSPSKPNLVGTQCGLTRSKSKMNLHDNQGGLTRSKSKPSLQESRGGLIKSQSKPSLQESQGGLTRSAATVADLSSIPPVPTSAPQPFLRSPSKFDRMKSILRHVSGSKPAPAPSAIPTLNRSPSKPSLERTLVSTPAAVESVKNRKHVNWTPDTVNKHSFTKATGQNSPSPMKSGIPRSTSKINFGDRTLFAKPAATKASAGETQYPSLDGFQSTEQMDVTYPSLPVPRPLPEPPRRIAQVAPPSVPGTFTLRSDSTISFGTSPKSFGSSAGQASVRQVRESLLPNMPGAFPGSSVNKENIAPIPSIPHGMANKKRRRVDSDDEAERSPKKHKAAEGHMLVAPKMQAENVSPKKVAGSAKKRGGLSLSRLNMLARPKNRK